MRKNISNYILHLSSSGLGISLIQFVPSLTILKVLTKPFFKKSFLYNEFFNCSHEAGYFSQNFPNHFDQGIRCWSWEVLKDKRTSISFILTQITSIHFLKLHNPEITRTG